MAPLLRPAAPAACRGHLPHPLNTGGLQHQRMAPRPLRNSVRTRGSASSGAASWGPADAGEPASKPSSSGSGSAEVPAQASSSSSSSTGSEQQQQPQRTVWQKIKHAFTGEKLDKERLKALGMGAFASYGVISNLNYGTALTMAWLAFVKLNGVAPTAPGMWPKFLAFYAGFWAVQNFVRPLRISLALALAPAFDSAITNLAARLNIPKGWAFGLFLLAMGITTSSILFSVIYLLGGFPDGLPSVFPRGSA